MTDECYQIDWLDIVMASLPLAGALTAILALADIYLGRFNADSSEYGGRTFRLQVNRIAIFLMTHTVYLIGMLLAVSFR